MNDIKFRTPYKRCDKRCAKCYSSEEPIYVKKVFEDGHVELVVNGKTDVDAKIQVAKDSVDIKKIVDKFRRTGDISLLHRSQGVDGVHLPWLDLKDVMNAKQELEKVWYNMSSDERSNFASFDDFCANRLNNQSAAAPITAQEVVTNEQKQENQ